MERFFRSQMIPFDKSTMCYWAESDDGVKKDVLPQSLPDGSVVTDVTFADDPRKVIKADGTFKLHAAS